MRDQATLVDAGVKSVRISQGSASPSCQQESLVACTVRSTKQSTTPHHAVPVVGTRLESHTKMLVPCTRTLPPRLMRKKGCQPRVTTCLNSQGAYRPRSASTRTVQWAGTLPLSNVNNSFQ